MSPDERLAELGLELPTIAPLPGGRQPRLDSVLTHGGLAYLSGVCSTLWPLMALTEIGSDAHLVMEPSPERWCDP
jgi:hypothetical protein